MTRLKALSSLQDAVYVIRSPAVGVFSPAAGPGASLSGGDAVGTIRVLNSQCELILPEGVRGVLVRPGLADRAIPVEYGQELFRLDPARVPGGAGQPGDPAEKPGAAESASGYRITAVTSGIFYRRASPGSPPYVTEGQAVEKGKILGLIEIMKVFNHIVFDGTESSSSGTVRKIYCEDAQEVKLGQPLFLIDLR